MESEKKCYIVTSDNQLDNLSNDIEILIIKCTPLRNLENLPCCLEKIYFYNSDVHIEEEEEEEEVKVEEVNNNTRDGSYFNYIHPYEFSNMIPTTTINTYSYSLNKKETYNIKIPFNCKVYDIDGKIKNCNGSFTVYKYGFIQI